MREAILDTAFRVLIARSHGGFAIKVVAGEAGAGKTTVYRWWKTKADLAVDAFLHATIDGLRLPDTGSAQTDFRTRITELRELLRDDRRQALAEMLGGARIDRTLACILGARWLEPLRRWSQPVSCF